MMDMRETHSQNYGHIVTCSVQSAGRVTHHTRAKRAYQECALAHYGVSHRTRLAWSRRSKMNGIYQR